MDDTTLRKCSTCGHENAEHVTYPGQGEIECSLCPLSSVHRTDRRGGLTWTSAAPTPAAPAVARTRRRTAAGRSPCAPFCGTRTPFQVPKRGPIVRIAEEDLQDLLALDVPVFGDPDWDELEEEHRLYKEDHDCA